MSSTNPIRRLSLGTILSVREVILAQSVSVAAERLGVSQSAVSQQINQFEKLTGITIASRNGNSMDVASGRLKSIILDAAAALGELQSYTSLKERNSIRLGISDCIGSLFFHSPFVHTELFREKSLRIASSATLIELFHRGELDAVIRPVFFHERDVDLFLHVPILWAGPKRDQAVDDERDDRPTINLILEASRSPYTHYIEQYFDKRQSSYKVIARIDDLSCRLKLAASTGGHCVIPEFAKAVLPKGELFTSPFGEDSAIRYGFFFNHKRVSVRESHTIFEMFSSHLSEAARVSD